MNVSLNLLCVTVLFFVLPKASFGWQPKLPKYHIGLWGGASLSSNIADETTYSLYSLSMDSREVRKSRYGAGMTFHYKPIYGNSPHFFNYPVFCTDIGLYNNSLQTSGQKLLPMQTMNRIIKLTNVNISSLTKVTELYSSFTYSYLIFRIGLSGNYYLVEHSELHLNGSDSTLYFTNDLGYNVSTPSNNISTAPLQNYLALNVVLGAFWEFVISNDYDMRLVANVDAILPCYANNSNHSNKVLFQLNLGLKFNPFYTYPVMDEAFGYLAP